MQDSFKILDQKDKEKFLEMAWQICLLYKGKFDKNTQNKIQDKIFELSEYCDKIPFLLYKVTYYDIWRFFHPKYGYSKAFKEMNRNEFQKFIEIILLD